jgi:diguanylate cyclase (GGDEF)-like protein
MTQDYVISLGDNDTLNTILKKYYKKWSNANYETSFNEHLTKNYFSYSLIDEQLQANFRSKRYVYGFIENSPYDYEYRNRLTGINNNILKGFIDLSDIEISFKKYKDVDSLVKDFNSNNIDFFYGNNATVDYKMDVYTTTLTFKPQMVIATHINNNISVNSLKSLEAIEVLVIANTKIAEVLTSNGVKVKTYTTLSKLLSNINNNSIIAIDANSYEYYSKTKLINYNVDLTVNLDSGSSYVVRDIEENNIFANFLDFYLSLINTNNVKNNALVELNKLETKDDALALIFIIGSYLAFLLTISIWVRNIIQKKKNSKKSALSKADKLKYIDMLTSLKNRNYLNDNIEKWDENDIYPQSIIIIDLNNIAYINDNYGHEEGDNVIREAANVLINNQVDNSDIMRTNGNEFMIYMVGHEEKQVVAHIRKLNKELKELNHNFGAAIGYSMIMDAIKTIDDAVNEATLDMRNNKEEINN